MNIGIDIDGVLTDIGTFLLNEGKNFFKKEPINKNGFSIEQIFECNDIEAHNFWKNNLLKYAITEKARDGASDFTKEIHKVGGKITIITSRVYTDHDNVVGKIMRFIVEEWLKLNKIEYDNIVYCSEDKSQAIIENNITVMIEDNPKNIIELSKLTNVICMNAPYNEHLKIENRIFSIEKNTINLVLKLYELKEQQKIEKRAFDEIKPLFGKASVDKPWMKYYSYSERNVELPKSTIYEYLYNNNMKNLNRISVKYFGRNITYRELFDNIDRFALSFKNLGVKEGDIVTLCLPNVPEAIYSFYGLNKLGAVANMVHPLKSGNEIRDCINLVKSKFLVAIDNSYDEINNIINDTTIKNALIVSAGDSMPLPMKIIYKKKFNKNINYSNDSVYLNIEQFFNKNDKPSFLPKIKYTPNTTAVIMYTGGTSGIPKGVEITNDNFNCMVHQQKATAKNFVAGDTMLTIMPVFHGFGLCSSIHMPLSYGISTVLVPKFDSKQFYNLISKYKPNHIFGVPKLWKTLISDKDIQKLDLSFMKYIVSGGENMKDGLEEEINTFLNEHGCYSKIKKGYGLSEAVAGTTLSDTFCNKIGSVGIPLVCNTFKVVKPGTQEEVDYNEEGEFCISGPTVMKQYFQNVDETKKILQKHNDGKIWLHTGDMGYMNEDGMLYYTDRLTRMYVTGGFNVYPPRIEKILETHDSVEACAVVPMDHPYKDIKVPRVYIILKNDIELTDELINELNNMCKQNLDVHHQPFKYEKISEFPLTNMGNNIGKIDYKALEVYENNKKILIKKVNHNA